jgi:phosphoribosylglycinamide formyltransferase-1
MVNIAVFASGRGSNFKAIIRAARAGRIKANLALLVCDNPDAGAIVHAKEAGIKTAVVTRLEFPMRKDFESAVIRRLREQGIGLIVLAGFMRILSPGFVRRYRNKILNIHPSLLPSFKGEHGIQGAFDYGVKVTGVTVHFVDEEMDHGPVVLQSPVKVYEKDTPATLEARIHKTEHRLYPEAIRLFTEGRLLVKGRKVAVTPPISRRPGQILRRRKGS